MTDIHFTRMSWNEYGNYCDKLYENIHSYLQEKGERVDLIISMMREGMFVGLPLSYKLNNYKVLPLHSKHIFRNGKYEILPMADFPKVYYEIPENPLILLTDILCFSGKSSQLAYIEVKKRFPTSRILFACILKDYTTVSDESFEKVFWVMTGDDSNKLTHEKAQELGIDKHVYLFPWQNEEEEKASILKQEYTY